MISTRLFTVFISQSQNFTGINPNFIENDLVEVIPVFVGCMDALQIPDRSRTMYRWDRVFRIFHIKL